MAISLIGCSRSACIYMLKCMCLDLQSFWIYWHNEMAVFRSAVFQHSLSRYTVCIYIFISSEYWQFNQRLNELYVLFVIAILYNTYNIVIYKDSVIHNLNDIMQWFIFTTHQGEKRWLIRHKIDITEIDPLWHILLTLNRLAIHGAV